MNVTDARVDVSVKFHLKVRAIANIQGVYGSVTIVTLCVKRGSMARNGIARQVIHVGDVLLMEGEPALVLEVGETRALQARIIVVV